jgi:hypothetical protein
MCGCSRKRTASAARPQRIPEKGEKPVRSLIKAAAALTSVLALSPAVAGWEPAKPVEIVVAA